jgi:hypothetical protein
MAVGQDVALGERDVGRFSLDNYLPPEVLTLVDATQAVANSADLRLYRMFGVWSPIGPLFHPGQHRPFVSLPA